MNAVTDVFKKYHKDHLGKYLLFYLIYVARILSLIAVPLVSKKVLDSVIPAGDTGGLILWTSIAVLAQLAVIFTQFGTSFFCRMLTTGLMNLMQTEMLKAFLERNSENGILKGTGYILKRIESDVELYSQYVNNDMVSLIYGVLMLLITMVLFYQYNVLLLVSTLLSLPLLIASMTLFNKKVCASTAEKNETIAKSSTFLSECILGRKEIREYSAIEVFTTKFANRLKKVYKATLNALRQQFKPGVTGQLSTLIGKASLLGIGGYALIQGKLTFGEYFAFSILVQYTYQAVGYLVQGNTSYQQSKAVVERMTEVFSGETSGPPEREESCGRKVALTGFIERIELRDAFFRYGSDSNDVLAGVSTLMRRGEVVCLVGPSGAGKTTLMGILKGEYRPQKGSVLVNGIPIEEIALDDFIGRTATVRQSPFIFSGSVRENIQMGRTATDQEMNEVVKLAHLDDFLDGLENGLETDINENAGNISGGQKQRIALARAFLRRPDILFLDEISTGMDRIARDKIHDSISGMRQRSIIVVISHSAETVLLADKVILLDKGSIVAEGSHADLLVSSGLYREMFEYMGNDDVEKGRPGGRPL